MHNKIITLAFTFCIFTGAKAQQAGKSDIPVTATEKKLEKAPRVLPADPYAAAPLRPVFTTTPALPAKLPLTAPPVVVTPQNDSYRPAPNNSLERGKNVKGD